MCHRLRLLLVKEAETPSVFSFVLPSVYLLVLTLFTTKGTTTTTTITSTTSTLLPHHLTYPVNITIHLILMKYQTHYFVKPLYYQSQRSSPIRFPICSKSKPIPVCEGI